MFSANEIVEVSMNGVWLSQAWSNVWTYEIDSIANNVNAAQFGEAWWNHVKDEYRGLAINTQPNVFESVVVKSLSNPTGEYGEYPVPTLERVGTRTPPANNQPLPPANAMGIRLAVALRTTRPGQKRLPFLLEEDVNTDQILSPFLALADALTDAAAAGITLGAPAALTVLTPVVVRRSPSGGVAAFQPVIGVVQNIYTTTQVSRRRGHGV